MMHPAPLLTRPSVSIKKVCEVAGVTRRTVYNWMAKGKVDFVRTAGGAPRILVDTIWTAGTKCREVPR